MNTAKEPAFNTPPATVYLVASLIVVHILLTVASADTVQWVYSALAFHVGEFKAVIDQPTGLGFTSIVFSLFGHLFLHHDFMHLLINAFMLLAFGAMVERAYGKFLFLFLFFVCGWAGALSEYVVSSSNLNAVLYGASGSVFGMMGITAWLMLPKFGLRKVLAFAGVMMGLNLVIGLTPLGGMLAGEGATISWAAHLGGFFTGAILPLVIRVRRV